LIQAKKTTILSIPWIHARLLEANILPVNPASAPEVEKPRSPSLRLKVDFVTDPTSWTVEIESMLRKWLIFGLSAGILVSLGIGLPSTNADDKEKETELGKIMEKVNKHNSTLTKGLRTKVTYAKSQKDVAKSAKELASLAKLAKPHKDAVKTAKDLPNADKKWDDWSDAFIKTAETLSATAAKPKAEFKETKDAFTAVKKSCADCHQDFRIDAAE
jgi:cytochrome c556